MSGSPTRDDLDALDALTGAIAAHDAQLARRGVEVWVGGEPTFTRPDTLAPAWTTAAEGDDKLARAREVAAQLGWNLGGVAARVEGRPFPDEPAPRFCWEVRWRDGAPAPLAPRPPLDEPPAPARPPAPGERLLTVTPDPGVVEVNTAPSPTLADLAAQLGAIWAAADAAGLSPRRHRYNGDAADSGGGGQLTLGGPTPEASPFVRYPHALPALVRYCHDHPALSYWFAGDLIGSASQAPRADEGARERFAALAVTLPWLDHLADEGALPPATLWAALAPLLVDAAGNTHRAELNVEKLWNPHLAAHGARHGRLGVVELRAIRMPPRPAMLVALAALLRAVVARLVVADYRAPLVAWGEDLHDRAALPALLEADLRVVLGDLDAHGLGLPAALRAELAAWRAPAITCRLGDATLELTRAPEAWPLVGDVASQERAAARIVDASSERWQLVVEGGPARVQLAGRWADLAPLPDGRRVVAVRRRVFEPSPGLLPGLPPLEPLTIGWEHAGRHQLVSLYAWRPGGGPYEGLPADDAEALARRAARVVVATGDGPLPDAPRWPRPAGATIDTRLAFARPAP